MLIHIKLADGVVAVCTEALQRYLTLRRHNCQIWKCTKWINGLQRIEQWTSTVQPGSPMFHISRCFPKISMFFIWAHLLCIWYNLWKVPAKMLFTLEDYIGRLLFYDHNRFFSQNKTTQIFQFIWYNWEFIQFSSSPLNYTIIRLIIKGMGVNCGKNYDKWH